MPTQSHKPKGIVFDTNLLLAIEGKHVDLLSQAKTLFGEKTSLVVTKKVMEELEELKQRGKTMEKAVKIAMQSMQNENVKTIETKARNADDSMVEAAKEGFLAATADKALRKRIKAFGGSVIYLRNNRLLQPD